MNGSCWSNAVSTTFRFCLLSIVCGSALAGVPRLVRDINAKQIAVSSYPTDFADFGSVSFFDADDGVRGIEPWTTDGTANGTFIWGDVTPGVSGTLGQQPIRVGSKLFIVQNDNTNGTRLWVSDGTPQTTHVISNANLTAAGVNAGALGALENNFVFTVFNTNDGARELWLSDGTDVGTHKIASADNSRYSVASFIVVGSKIYFMSLTPLGIVEPWISDGTTAGTHRLAAIPNSTPEPIAITDLARVGNYVLFAAATSDTGRELWRIDIRDDSISEVRDIAPGSGSAISEGTRFGVVNNLVVFSASATADNNITLWRTDGTTSGTFSIAAVAAYNDLPAYIGTATSRILFRVIVNNASQLWSTDGTVTGTQMLRDPAPYPITQIGSRFYFFDSTQKELWISDGTTAGTNKLAFAPSSGSEILKDIAGDDTAIYLRTSNAILTGNVYKYSLVNSLTTLLASYAFSENVIPRGVFAFAQGHLYFDNEDASRGRELWISDGTAATTRLLKNLAPETQTLSSAPADFVRFNGELFFTAEDGDHGREVWRSDGTEGGTNLLIDLNPGLSGSSPSDLFVANGYLYFFAVDGSNKYQLWVSDGTALGTHSLGQVMPRPTSERYTGCDSKGVVMNSAIYFAGFDNSVGLQLWKIDGANVGATRVTSVATPSFGAFGVCYLTAVGNRIFFQANAGTDGSELWVSDGTAAGTSQLLDIFPGGIGSGPSGLTSLGGKLYFLANDGAHGTQLWTSDGTNSGTHVSASFGSGTPVGIQGLAGKLLVPIGSTVWSTDGAAALQLTNAVSVFAGAIFVNNGFAYFSGVFTNGTTIDIEPWVSNGTPAGTHMLLDTNPTGLATSGTFTDFDGITVFQTMTSVGRQLWRTNGTTAGTKLMGNFDIGATRLAANHALFYVGNDSASGTELFAIDNSRPISAGDSLGTIEAGKSASLNVLANDSDVDGNLDTNSVTIVTQPSGGSISIGTGGVLTYTARANFVGTDSFTYSVADDQGFMSAGAAVQVTVAASTNTNQQSSGGGGAFELQMIFLSLGLLLLRSSRRLGRHRMKLNQSFGVSCSMKSS